MSKNQGHNQRSQVRWCLHGYPENTENLIKLHRKVKHNEKVCHTPTHIIQDYILAKGSGAFVTYYNLSYWM